MEAVTQTTGTPFVAPDNQHTTGASLRVHRRTIQARLPFAYKDALKALPGATWDSRQRCWTFPLSALSARRLIDLAPDAAADETVTEYAARCATVDEAIGLGIPASYSFRTALRPAQIGALACVAHLDAAMLEMWMRTGKSKVIVDWVSNQIAVRALILCPKGGVDVWVNPYCGRCNHNPQCPLCGEFAKHSHNPPMVVGLGDGAIKRRAADAADAVMRRRVVIVVNYDAARCEPLRTFLLSVDWALVVLDESHKIKSPGGATSMFCRELAKVARKRVALTGTPIPNSPLDVYAQFRFIDQSVFGASFNAFRNRFAVVESNTTRGGQQYPVIVRYKNLDALAAAMSALTYKVGRDALGLPPVIQTSRYVTLGDKARKAYDQMETDLVAEIQSADGSEYAVAQNTLTKLLRLAQIASGYLPREDGQPEPLDSGKREALGDILEDIGDVPVVVFCRFHTDLDAVHAACAERCIRSVELSGRRRELAEFQNGDAPVIAVQIQVGDSCINLSRASVVVYYSIGYSLGDYKQSLARMEQKGKKESTLCIHIIAKNTVDDGHIHPVLRKKQSIVDFVSARIQNDSTNPRNADGAQP